MRSKVRLTRPEAFKPRPFFFGGICNFLKMKRSFANKSVKTFCELLSAEAERMKQLVVCTLVQQDEITGGTFHFLLISIVK